MRKIIIWFLVLISLSALLLRYSNKWTEIFLGIKPVSGISILSEPTDAAVFIDNKEVGKTPYSEKNLEVRDYLVKIEKDKASWTGKVRLTEGTVTVINRDLANDLASSGGEVLILEKGKGLTIISNPSDSDVEVDGKTIGRTPITIDVPKGEHNILLSHANYLKRSIKVDLPEGFNLAVTVDLALSEADLSTIATPVITQTPEVLVKNTPTGFLRVRDKPTLNGKEITQLRPGDKLILLEEQGEWYRVRMNNGTEGYASSAYLEKINL